MSNLQGRRILVVDDEPYVLGVLRNVLSDEGAKVYTAVNGTEALRMLPSVRPDVVLLDDRMPDMDGWQVCLRIREQSSVPIILLPAGGLRPDNIRREDAGITDCVPKPFHPDTLIARIRAAERQAK
jgi:two-component system response regulator ResD